ncbi:MAG: SUMF1/EgtB/PvdO family nonheme iron enzyme [Pedobacter sp.]|uniref:formylglycine-generating enzyme family protein n=1 Tax=Pedobacter sp. TaxID=1411316 RepID=UPI0035625546
MRITISSSFLLLSSFFSYGQNPDFKNYSQAIPQVDVKIEMIAIPSGTFTMGSPAEEKNRKNDEGPQIPVKLNAFWMGKYEIPWDIYELFVFDSLDPTRNNGQNNKLDGVTRPTSPYLDMTFGMGKQNHPAVGMTQYNAIQFCKWLYSRTGNFYRLPTEAEWEYASRSGAKEIYHFGNDEDMLKDYAWYAVNSNNKTHPIGTKKPNSWGLYDMYGNVSEWTFDQYSPDTYQKNKGKLADNPIVIPKKLYPHSVRGGSFKEDASKLRSASRNASSPDWKRLDPQTPKSNWWLTEPYVGLRIVRPLVEPSKKEIDEYYAIKPIPDY